MFTAGKIERRSIGRQKSLRSALQGESAPGGIQLQSLSASVLPKVPIRVAYYIFIFALPFEGAIGGLSLVGLILVGVTLVQPRLFLNAPPSAFWYFVAYWFVVAVLGLLIMLSGPQDTGFKSELVTQLFRASQLLVFFLIAYRLMTFELIAQRTLLLLGISCIILAFLQIGGIVSTEAHGRVSAFDENPNVLALMLSAGVLCMVGLAYGRKGAGVTLRVFVWCSSALLLVGIVNTGSRGSMLALALAVVILVFKPGGILQRAKIVFIVAVVLGFVVWSAYQIDTVRERWENTYHEGEIAGRDLLFPVAWEMFFERPIIGWGPVNHYWEMNIRTGDPDGGDPHNTYLWVLKQTGILGFLPFFVGLYLSSQAVWKARFSSHGSLPLALLVLILANNLKGTYLFFKIFWFVLAYALASGTYVKSRSQT